MAKDRELIETPAWELDTTEATIAVADEDGTVTTTTAIILIVAEPGVYIVARRPDVEV